MAPPARIPYVQAHHLMIWCGCFVSASSISHRDADTDSPPSMVQITSPTDLLCELRLDPVGIESRHPRFSWASAKAVDDQRVANQSAVRVWVAAAAHDGGKPVEWTMWDTGIVDSAVQHVLYAGPALQPATSYWWKVQTWDSEHRPSSESEPARFVTALWNTWSAEAVWAGHEAVRSVGEQSAETDRSTEAGFFFFRHEALIPRDVSAAFAFITTQPQQSGVFTAKLLGGYRLYIEGDVIGTGPGRPGRCGPTFPPAPFVPNCTREHVYDSYDITSQLTKSSGGNVTFAIATYAAAGSAEPKVVLQVEVLTATGGRRTVGTGIGEWRWFPANTYKNPTPGAGPEYAGMNENMNALAEPAGWKHSGFAYLNKDWNLVQIRARNFSDGAPLVAKPTPPVKVMTAIVPSKITSNRTTDSLLIDMGRNVMGGLDVAFQAGTTGHRLEVTLSEELTPDGLPMVPMRTGNSYKSTWTLRSGPQTFEHHEYMVWRYALIAPAPPAPPPPRPPSQCAETPLIRNAHDIIHLKCARSGEHISEVIFASYGTPTGHCKPNATDGSNSFRVSDCNAPRSQLVVETKCKNKNSCAIDGWPSTFGGDPCDGTTKRFVAAVGCTAAKYGSAGRRQPAPLHDAEPTVRAWVVHYPFDASFVQFQSSSPLLDKVFELCKYTLQATTIDMYTDSNTRQRDPVCMESVNINALTHYYSTREFVAQRYTIEYSLNEPYSQLGMHQGLWPGEWYPITVMAVHEWTFQTGDLSLATKYYNQLKEFTWLGFVNASSGLVDCATEQNGSHSMSATCTQTCTTIELDWPENMRDGWTCDSLTDLTGCKRYSTVLNAYTYRGLTDFSQLASVLGHEDDAVIASNTARRLQSAMNKYMFNGTAWCDGLCSESPHTSFHTSAFALAFGVPDASTEAPTTAYVAARALTGAAAGDAQQEHDSSWIPAGSVTGDNTGHSGIPANVYLGQWCLEALYRSGSDHGQHGLAMMLSNGTNAWLNMIRTGATTTMEAWTRREKPNLSWSHPWAASPGNIIPRLLFGIVPTAPGYSSMDIKPQPGHLAHAQIEIPSVRGRIAVSFRQRLHNASSGTSVAVVATHFVIMLDLPANTVARVHLPASAIHQESSVAYLDGVEVHAELDESAEYCVVEGVHGGGMRTVASHRDMGIETI